jgi:hypothetical protein
MHNGDANKVVGKKESDGKSSNSNDDGDKEGNGNSVKSNNKKWWDQIKVNASWSIDRVTLGIVKLADNMAR